MVNTEHNMGLVVFAISIAVEFDMRVQDFNASFYSLLNYSEKIIVIGPIRR